MRINEYNSLDEFIYEYDSGRRPSTETHGRKFMGIEFLHGGVYYRMCFEPAENDGERRFYYVYIMHCETQGYPAAERFETIGRYENFKDLLENFLIDGKSFKEVIMNDNTEILGKD
ncbi:MAG: hypothetical protein IJQ85_10655 [Selenomonadaceae bacterium]|nr:hypothetical protein [Selenomonadaceae bacterium]